MIKPIIVRNSRVPVVLSVFMRIAAITLWPFVFIREGCDDERLIHHESIHIYQFWECGVVGFYPIYLWDWLRGWLKYKDVVVAYRHIRFEQEAYQHEADTEYLTQRKRFAWRNYQV